MIKLLRPTGISWWINPIPFYCENRRNLTGEQLIFQLLLNDQWSTAVLTKQVVKRVPGNLALEIDFLFSITYSVQLNNFKNTFDPFSFLLYLRPYFYQVVSATNSAALRLFLHELASSGSQCFIS